MLIIFSKRSTCIFPDIYNNNFLYCFWRKKQGIMLSIGPTPSSLNPPIWKPTDTAFLKTLTFYQCFFNSRSNMHRNLNYWSLLHPKKAILPTFCRTHTYFFEKSNNKNRIYNLHHQSLSRLRVHHIQTRP